MTKNELIEKIWEDIPIYRRSQLRKKWIKFVVDEVFNSITECTIKGEPVNIHKFGSFLPIVRKSRRIFSPSENRFVMSKDKLKMKFRPGSTLRKLLEESL